MSKSLLQSVIGENRHVFLLLKYTCDHVHNRDLPRTFVLPKYMLTNSLTTLLSLDIRMLYELNG